MTSEKSHRTRRAFFSKIAAGVFAGGIVSKVIRIAEETSKTSSKKISISINPMAVKRTNKG